MGWFEDILNRPVEPMEWDLVIFAASVICVGLPLPIRKCCGVASARACSVLWSRKTNLQDCTNIWHIYEIHVHVFDVWSGHGWQAKACWFAVNGPKWPVAESHEAKSNYHDLMLFWCCACTYCGTIELLVPEFVGDQAFPAHRILLWRPGILMD